MAQPCWEIPGGMAGKVFLVPTVLLSCQLVIGAWWGIAERLSLAMERDAAEPSIRDSSKCRCS
jgi:hypothetical protein